MIYLMNQYNLITMIYTVGNLSNKIVGIRDNNDGWFYFNNNSSGPDNKNLINIPFAVNDNLYFRIKRSSWLRGY